MIKSIHVVNVDTDLLREQLDALYRMTDTVLPVDELTTQSIKDQDSIQGLISMVEYMLDHADED